MAQVLVTESYLSGIASAIRYKNGQSVTYKPSQMESAIRAIASAGDLSIISKSITSNGSYSPSGDGADAFSDVIVDVPNSFSASDEGKVVSSGSLVAQSSMSILSNGTYDTTLNDEVVVSVPTGGSGVYVSKNIIANGTYNPEDDNADAYSQVVVNVPSGGGGLYSDAFAVLVQSMFSGGHFFVDYTQSGAVFSNASAVIYLPVRSMNDITIYFDVLSMSLTSGGHRRFVMGYPDCGFIYRSTGVWGFYSGNWEDTDNTDGGFFNNSVVKLYIDDENHWHIYKNNYLFFEPKKTVSIGSIFTIGASQQAINNAVIGNVRVYQGDYTEVL